MRLIGLTLCLLTSTFAARAEVAEGRVAALEARVQALEMALSIQGGEAVTPDSTGSIKDADGTE